MKYLEHLTDAPFSFTLRPQSIPPDLRPIWRAVIIVLFLDRCCRQSKSSLKKLHVLNWAVRTPSSRQSLLDFLDGATRPDRTLVRFDPALNRALDVARGEKWLEQVAGDRYQITARGKGLTEEVMASSECLLVEKWFMSAIGGRVTETAINNLLNKIS